MGLQPGSIVENKFEILEELGAGGMGTVYKAEHLTMSRTVVLKVLSPSDNTSKSIIRFQNEAKILGRLKHPGIAEVYDVGVADGGLIYLSLEYIDGITMQRLIESEEKLPLSQLIQIFIEIADALSHAHSEGIVHRDIKPGNIMLVKTEDGLYAPVLLDFGIAKHDTANGEDQRLTEVGLAIGSPLYMSPEQCVGEKITTSSDQYSLGCVLFECLTGEPPFHCDNALDTMQMHCHETPPDPADGAYIEIPTQLSEMITLMLAKKPEERFESMHELIGELVEVRDLATESERVPPPPTETVESYNLKRFLNRRVLVICGCIASIIGIAFTVSIYRKDQQIKDSKLPEAPRLGKVIDTSIELTTLMGPNVDVSKYPLVTDEFMVRFANRTDLLKADLSHASITDEGLKFLLKSQNLVDLRVKDTDVKTLKYLPKFKSLEWFIVSQTDIDDAALKNLVPLQGLTILELEDCPRLTDSCLEQLKKMPSLDVVDLRETNVSKAAMLAAAKTMPSCRLLPFVEKSLLADNIRQASQYQAAGKTEKALQQYKICLDTVSSARGSNSPQTIQPLMSMSACYDKLGRIADGRACAEKALAIARACGTKTMLAVAINHLSQHLLISEIDVPGALKLRREHLKVLTENGEINDYSARDSMYLLAQVLLLTPNKLDESEELFRKCFSIDQKMYNAKIKDYNSREVAKLRSGSDLHGVGIVQIGRGDGVTAEKTLREALVLLPEPKKPQDGLQLAEVYVHMAQALDLQGRRDEGVECWQRAGDLTKSFQLPSAGAFEAALKKAIVERDKQNAEASKKPSK